MTISLPASTRGIDCQGYKISTGTVSESTPFEFGPGKLRRRSLQPKATVSLSWTMTSAEFADFEQWWQGDCAFGTEEFYVGIINGYSEAVQAVRALGSYSAQWLNNYWSVTLPVEVSSQPIASSAELAEAISSYDDLSQAATFHATTHHTMPWGLS